MTTLRSIALSLSLFSRIPLPRQDFARAYGPAVLAALPLVGVMNGFVLWGWLLLAGAAGFGTILTAAGLTLLPVALTGGIHLDGFADTVDALASRAPKERKVEILADPNIGAFAGIALAAYLLLYFALGCEYVEWVRVAGVRPFAAAWMLGAVSVMSRAWAATLSLSGRHVQNGDILATLVGDYKGGGSLYRRGKAPEVVSVVCFLVGLAGIELACVLFGLQTENTSLPFVGTFGAAAVAGCAVYTFWMSLREFGGMTGDIAGYAIQIAEIWALGAIVCVGATIGGGTFL
ncbi:MAG: adenosylcobinamide-GDP ribazoletransferase [Clostridiales Family XIII bacterium]|jgi:adenosylcobinamide-GDP ribazoletransferase|nr:adenosylcobinamide-GDP ribazoletransferase [Clostridiales Family XIII bacterium]